MAKKNESESKREQPEHKPKLNEEQYEILKRCSDKEDMTEWNKWVVVDPNRDIFLEGANLSDRYLKGVWLKKLFSGGVYLQDANFNNSDLEGAQLKEAHLEGADLSYAVLRRAKVVNCHLEGTHLLETELQGAIFLAAIVDGSTLIWECEVDRHTDFRGVSLDTVRIDPGTKQLLEYNIRRMNWEKWYRVHWLLRWPVRWFWWMSDYGRSTGRIAGTFFVLAFFFAAIYSNMAYWCPPGIVSNLEVESHLPIWHYFLLALLRPIYFSVVTMTTLGFGDMYANAQSIWGHILLTFQVILGYVLLGALVTRFAVLFTAGGPAGEFEEEKKEGEEGRI